MLLTIFTPTYNRSSTLPRLYASLCRQTCQDFEWVIVDDGSTDNTHSLVASWQSEERIPIRYEYQHNAGKMAAHNLGAELAAAALFVCVDSDDYLADHAVEQLLRVWQQPHNDCIGMLAFKVRTDGTPVTTLTDETLSAATLKAAYDHHGLSGDTMLVYACNVLKKHSFPIVHGEKFIPEGYLYDQLDQEGQLLILRDGLYICEYLEDGYTANMAWVLYSNPQGYFTYINQRLQLDSSAKSRLLDSIRYVGMAIAHKRPLRKSARPLWAYAALLPGYLLYIKRYKRFTR